MITAAEIVFRTSILKVQQLLEISYKQKTRIDSELLKQAAMVFLVAIWQDFISRLSNMALTKLFRNSSSPDKIPNKIKANISQKMKDIKNELEIWKLTGEGWREISINHLEKYIESFNTPNTDKINTLFERTIGYEQISNNWKWRKMTPIQSRNKLDTILTIRHEIAHQGRTKTTLTKGLFEDYLHFIHRLAANTFNSIGKYLKTTISDNSWNKMVYKGTVGIFDNK
jgi:hypothetical protein